MLTLRAGSLRLRHQGVVFTRPLLLGLALALLFHGLPFVLFRFTRAPGSHHSQVTVSGVIADATHQHQRGPYVDAYGLLPRHLNAPKVRAPNLPQVPSSMTRLPLERTKPLPSLDLPHTATSYEPIPAGELFATSYPPVTITLSEGLKGRELLVDPSPTQKKRRLVGQQTRRYFLSFRVRIDERSGRIFAIRPEIVTDIDAIDHRMERFVRRILFAPDPGFLITEGVVELTLELPR